MQQPDKDILEQQKKAAAFLTRPRLRIEPKSPEILAAEAKIEANEKARLEAEFWVNLRAGDKMPDGSIYLGFYNKKDWFVTAENPRAAKSMFNKIANFFTKDTTNKNLQLSFNDAAAYAKNLKAHGHDDWTMPPGYEDPSEPDILKEMFIHKDTGAFRGTYDLSDGTNNADSYWSSTTRGASQNYAEDRNFRDGKRGPGWPKIVIESVRCVRSAPRPSFEEEP